MVECGKDNGGGGGGWGGEKEETGINQADENLRNASAMP